MSKGIDASQTQTSEYSYQQENENNSLLAMKMIEQVAPVIAEFERTRESYGFTHADLLDLMYNINLVKNHGYGVNLYPVSIDLPFDFS